MFGKSAFGSTGGFGQQPQQNNSVFGQQPQQQQQPSAFGGKRLNVWFFFELMLNYYDAIGFGATSAPGAFGAAPAATGGAFGQPAQQQSAFGAAPATGN